MMGIRKMLELIFTPNELKILDDTLPEFKRKEKLDHEEALEQEVHYFDFVLEELTDHNPCWSAFHPAMRKVLA